MPATVYFIGNELTFWGARLVSRQHAPKRMDFVTMVAKDECASWAFRDVFTHDNGKAIAAAIATGKCKAVFNGSFKAGMGTAAWTL